MTLATSSEPHILCGSTAAPFCLQLHGLNHKPAKGADGQQLCHSKLRAFLLLGDLSRRFPHYDVRTGRSITPVEREGEGTPWQLRRISTKKYVDPVRIVKGDQLHLRVGFEDPSLASDWAFMSATTEDNSQQPNLGEWSEQAG